MCAQCMMAASTAAAGASGLRAWLAARRFAWVTPGRLRFMTILLIAFALIGSSVSLNAT
jgi:hypothetical protein